MPWRESSVILGGKSAAYKPEQLYGDNGDTIHLDGEANGMRFVGFNTPEVFHPQCAAEKELGDEATA